MTSLGYWARVSRPGLGSLTPRRQITLFCGAVILKCRQRGIWASHGAQRSATVAAPAFRAGHELSKDRPYAERIETSRWSGIRGNGDDEQRHSLLRAIGLKGEVVDRNHGRGGAVWVTATSGSGGARRYSPIAQACHWISAALFLTAVILGWVFVGMPAAAAGRFVYITLHKSIGQTIFFLALFRLVWRRMHPPPPLDGSVAVWEARIAKVNHRLLYAIMILMPLTGYILAVAAARPSPYFWLFYWPQPTLSRVVTHAALRAHLFGQFLVYAFVGLHVVGVVWHVVIRRDATLERMLPAQIERGAEAASASDDAPARDAHYSLSPGRPAPSPE